MADNTKDTMKIGQENIVIDYNLINLLIPTYDGNPKTLNYYIRSVDIMIRTQKLNARDPILACLIRAKLTAEAVEALTCEVDIDDWNSIKSALIHRFSDHRIPKL